MRTRFFRPLATMISLLLLVAVPAQASPIKFADVMNVMGDLRSSQIEQLRLRTVAQDPNGQTPSSASKTLAGPTAPAIDTDVQIAAPSLIAGAEVAVPQQPQGEVQVFEQDNVDGTICDCGEIPAVGGGFPKWPFLFLAAIPLLFIRHHDTSKVCPTCDTCPTCPTPTPTPPPQVPEPTSLLLFGSGIVALTAGARRRYAKMRASKQAATTTEV